MSEAWGKVIIKASDEIHTNLAKDNRYVNEETISQLLTYAGLMPSIDREMGFSIEGVQRKGNYVALDIFDGNWIELARNISRNGKNIEIYAYVGDEYGTVVFCALNQDCSNIEYWYEQDGGDESCQDGFDEDAFYKEISDKKNKWLSLIPQQVKNDFPDLLPEEN